MDTRVAALVKPFLLTSPSSPVALLVMLLLVTLLRPLTFEFLDHFSLVVFVEINSKFSLSQGLRAKPERAKHRWWESTSVRTTGGDAFTKYLCYILYTPRALRSWLNLARACTLSQRELLCTRVRYDDVRCHVGDSTVNNDGHKLEHHIKLVRMYSRAVVNRLHV